MPAVEEKSLILVTGASGFVAVWTCQELLQAGFKVCGTVRNREKGEYLKELFQAFDKKFSYVIVEDIGEKSAFDNVIDGVDAIAHIASPVPSSKVEDFRKDIIDPAINGTLSLLESAKLNQRVKRVVITSSYAAVTSASPRDPNYVLSEKDWNDQSPHQLETQGDKIDTWTAYAASKALAERSAWKFMDEQKPGFDLVTLCPPWVYGPIIHQVKSVESLNTSVKLFYMSLTGNLPAYQAAPCVDVRDLALAHCKALTTECAGGNRYAISNVRSTFNYLLGILVDKQPDKFKADWPHAPEFDGNDKKIHECNHFDSSKAQQQLGLKYRPVEETVLDMCQSLKELLRKAL